MRLLIQLTILDPNRYTFLSKSTREEEDVYAADVHIQKLFCQKPPARRLSVPMIESSDIVGDS